MAYNLPYLGDLLDRLRAELPPARQYHSVLHTRDEVLPAAERLADMMEISADQKHLLLAAAAFHDTGYVNGPDAGHEERSIAIAQDILLSHGFTAEQIDTIANIIRATKWPQRPHNLTEQIMSDADLSMLGHQWEKFLARSNELRAENEAVSGKSISQEEWYKGQIEFLSAHNYFTDAAHALFDEQKASNIAHMREYLKAHKALMTKNE